MKWKIVFLSGMLSILSPLIISDAALAYDFPLNIEYQFPEVDPVKIYAGGVVFSHEAHIADYKISCVRCHHTLKPGDTQVNTKCRVCHVKEGFPRFEAAAGLSDKEKKEYYLVVLHKRCIDCHMAVYNVTESGREERYHNMKVAANDDPATCRPCHEFEKAEVSARCVELVPSFSSIVHAVPPFE